MPLKKPGTRGTPRFKAIVTPRALEIVGEVAIITRFANEDEFKKKTGLFKTRLVSVKSDGSGIIVSTAYIVRLLPGAYVMKVEPEKGVIHILIPDRATEPRTAVEIREDVCENRKDSNECGCHGGDGVIYCSSTSADARVVARYAVVVKRL